MTLIRSDAIYPPPSSIAGATIPDSKLAHEVIPNGNKCLAAKVAATSGRPSGNTSGCAHLPHAGTSQCST